MYPGILTALITGLFSIIVSLITVWSNHHLTARKAEKQRRKEEQITDSDVEDMLEVQEYLNVLVDKWEFDRGAIYQFHNGGKFFNGIAMKKFSLTFESISAGIARVKEVSQNIFVTEHPSLIKHVSCKDFFYIDSDDAVLDYMREKIEEQGILQLITVPLRSLNSTLLGFIQFSTIKHEVEITEEMQTELIEAGRIISGYLHK
jgi:hypothetical protein